MISFLFLDIIRSILSIPKKRNSQSKWNSNFHPNIFSQWSNNGQVSSRNLYRVRQATWLVVIADQQKASEDPPYAGTSGNNRVVTRSSSPISRLFFCLIPPPVSPPFTSSYHQPLDSFSDSSSCILHPNQLIRVNNWHATFSFRFHLPSVPLFVLQLDEENYCFSRILLFYHFWNSSGVYGPLEWLLESFLSCYLLSLRFMGREDLYKYRLQECLCEIERWIRWKEGWDGTVGFRESG